MKRTFSRAVLILFFIVAAGQFAVASFDKDAIYEAAERYKSGQQLTDRQLSLLESLHFNFYPSDNELDDFGGPDGYGYSYKDSEEPDGPVYEWVEIPDGTEVLLGDEDWAGAVPIGFEFQYYDEVYSFCWIQSNGVISFFNNYVSLFNFEMPYDDYGAMIAWFWDDLDPDMGEYGMVYFDTITLEDELAFVVNFENYHEYGFPPDEMGYITAQVILFESGDIVMQYADLGSPQGITIDECTIGIQGSGNRGFTFLFDGDPEGNPFENQAIRFYYSPPDVTVTGTVTNSETGEVIEGAYVRIDDTQTQTGLDGVYTIEEIYSGDHTIDAYATGYYEFSTTGFLDPGINTIDIPLLPYPENPWPDPYSTDFEDSQGHLARTVYSISWEWGEPTINPDSANSPTHCWVTSLDSNYPDNANDYLLSTTSHDILSEDAYLLYWHWYELEEEQDGYNVRISTDQGTTWQLLSPWIGYPDSDGVVALDQACFSGSSDGWESKYFSLQDYVDMNVMFMFYMASDDQNNLPGVAIDDLTIFPGVGPPELELNAMTVDPDPLIGQFGGSFDWIVELNNHGNYTTEFEAWTEVMTPGGQLISPLFVIRNLDIDPHENMGTALTQNVPGYAPGGTFTYYTKVGDLELVEVYAEDSFTFDKLPPDAQMSGSNIVSDWSLTGWETEELDTPERHSTIPSAYTVERAYPNPFNPVTHISVGLPSTSDLSVLVYNITGQRVAVLAEGYYGSGYHSFTFNGAGLSSGVYFINTVIPGEIADLQKIVMVK